MDSACWLLLRIPGGVDALLGQSCVDDGLPMDATTLEAESL